MKFITLLLISTLFSFSAYSRNLNYENLLGTYHLKSSLAKNQAIVLELEPNQLVHVSKIKDNVQGPRYEGSFALEDYTEFNENGNSTEQMITITGSHEGKNVKIIVYFKNVGTKELSRGANVTLDINMDGKTMNNIWVEMKKQ